MRRKQWRGNILLGVLVWYLAEVVRLGGGTVEIWGKAVGIAVIVGGILVLSAMGDDRTIRSLGGWRIFRFFLIPFCVSSYSTLTHGRGYWLVFSPEVGDNLINLLTVVVSLVLAGFLRRLRR